MLKAQQRLLDFNDNNNNKFNMAKANKTALKIINFTSL